MSTALSNSRRLTSRRWASTAAAFGGASDVSPESRQPDREIRMQNAECRMKCGRNEDIGPYLTSRTGRFGGAANGQHPPEHRFELVQRNQVRSVAGRTIGIRMRLEEQTVDAHRDGGPG